MGSSISVQVCKKLSWPELSCEAITFFTSDRKKHFLNISSTQRCTRVDNLEGPGEPWGQRDFWQGVPIFTFFAFVCGFKTRLHNRVKCLPPRPLPRPYIPPPPCVHLFLHLENWAKKVSIILKQQTDGNYWEVIPSQNASVLLIEVISLFKKKSWEKVFE